MAHEAVFRKPGLRALFPAFLIVLNGLLLATPPAAAGPWTKVDLGTPEESFNSHLLGIALGDGDRDNVTELYVGSDNRGHVYQYRLENGKWAGHDLGVLAPWDSQSSDHVAVGDGDDDGLAEVYVCGQVVNLTGSYDAEIYQYVNGPGGWTSTKIGGYGFHATGIAMGDGNNDGRTEIYVSDEDSGIYQTALGNEWSTQCLGFAPLQYWANGGYWSAPPMEGVVVGDGDNDGQNEVYGACSDSHIYRFNRTASGWTRTDLGGQNDHPQSNFMNGLALGDLDNDGQKELYGFSMWNGTLWQYRWNASAAAWERTPVLNVAGADIGRLVRLCIARNGFLGRNELYAGLGDDKVYRILLDNATGKWECSPIGSGGGLIMGAAAGTPSGDPGVLEVFAACLDGHVYEFYEDLAPPANPAVWSDTHPVAGKWYNASAVHVLWRDVGRDISGVGGYSVAWDTSPGTIPDDVADRDGTAHDLTTGLADGAGWHFHIRSCDGGLRWNQSAAHFGPVNIDTVRPDSASLAVNGGAAATRSRLVDLALEATDPSPSSGLDRMAFSNDGSNWSGWEPYGSTRPGWDLADDRFGGNGSDGPKTVLAKVMDAAGNELAPERLARADILLDQGAPAGLSIAINDGAGYTNRTEVVLALAASDAGSEVAGMSFSNNGRDWSEWAGWAGSSGWSLTAGAGGAGTDGLKTVHFRARDQNGNVGGPVSASIFLDRSAPFNLSLALNGGAWYANSSAVRLDVSASDRNPSSGLSRMALSNDPAFQGPWEDYSDAVDGWDLAGSGGTDADGPKTVRLDVADRAGNAGGPALASIFLDRASPVRLSLTINNGSAATNDANTTLALAASDPEPGSGVALMQFSGDGLAWTAWEPFAATRDHTLAAPDGNKTVFFRVRDRAGNVAGPASASILLDTAVRDLAPPAISGLRVTNITNNSALISWTTDEPSGSFIEYGPGSTFGLNLSSGHFTQEHAVLLSGLSPGTTYHFRVRSADPAGNVVLPGPEGNFTTLAEPSVPTRHPRPPSVIVDASYLLLALALVAAIMIAAAAVIRRRARDRKKEGEPG